jgi:hypothetical protein
MTFLWILTSVALVTAILAWRAARKTARRLEQVSEMFWALKYQHGELRGQLQQISSPRTDAQADGPAAAPEPRPTDSFVPLASLRR